MIFIWAVGNAVVPSNEGNPHLDVAFVKNQLCGDEEAEQLQGSH